MADEDQNSIEVSRRLRAVLLDPLVRPTPGSYFLDQAVG